MADANQETIAGSVLLSHPTMRHDAFRRTVVLIAAHDAGGAMGVILNRPLSKKLGELNENFAKQPIGDLPLYEGGPVAEKQIVFAGWYWSAPDHHFHLQFGLSKERVADIIVSDPGFKLRGFLGHAGWASGQLENELKHNAWVVSPMDASLIGNLNGVELWRALLSKHHPGLRLLAEAPDSPEFN